MLYTIDLRLRQEGDSPSLVASQGSPVTIPELLQEVGTPSGPLPGDLLLISAHSYTTIMLIRTVAADVIAGMSLRDDSPMRIIPPTRHVEQTTVSLVKLPPEAIMPSVGDILQDLSGRILVVKAPQLWMEENRLGGATSAPLCPPLILLGNVEDFG